MKNTLSTFERFYIYQKERFPFLLNGIMIGAFTFSAISYSRICRGVEGYISATDFLVGFITSFSFFFLLRICDEHKDQKEDALYRSYLPVPRGLVSLKELRNIGIALVAIQLFCILLFQVQMLGLYLLVLGYLALMTKEFFVAEWLKGKQILYIVSHMMIIPLVDLYSSGLDWKLAGTHLHTGILWFIALSFFNGLVLEIGRKIRTPETEEVGVVSYTKLYGTKRAAVIWLALISTTMLLCYGAMYTAAFPEFAIMFLLAGFILSITPALSFLNQSTSKSSKFIEYGSGLWTIIMYLSLGVIPLIKNSFV